MQIASHNVLVMFGALLFIACGCSPSKPDETLAIRWINEIPYQEYYNTSKMGPPVDWKAWSSRGRAIPDAPVVLRRLLGNRDKRVALPVVALALGLLGDESSVPVLVESLHNPDRQVRIQVCIALGMLHPDRSGIDALGLAIASDSDDTVRLNAVVSLEKIGGPVAIEHLRQASRDRNPDVAKWAAQALKGVAPAADALQNTGSR